MHEMMRWLEVYRFKEDLSQRQMAKKLDVTPTYYGLLLSGKRQPGNKFRTAVRRAFPKAPGSLFLPSTVHNKAIANGQ